MMETGNKHCNIILSDINSLIWKKVQPGGWNDFSHVLAIRIANVRDGIWKSFWKSFLWWESSLIILDIGGWWVNNQPPRTHSNTMEKQKMVVK